MPKTRPPRPRRTSRRPGPASPPRRPRGNTRYYNRNIPSLGLTEDTARGPVDLVALEHALAGKRVWLSRVECVALAERLHQIYLRDPEEYALALRNVAAARGVQVAAVKRMVTRHRRPRKAVR